VAAHVLAHHVPDGEQHALALVVAGPVLVGLAEVAQRDGTVDRADDVAERDGLGFAGQHVAPAHAPLRPHQPGALQRQQDLLEVGLGQRGALGDVADRRGTGVVAVQGQREQGSAGVVTPGGHLHPDHCTGIGRWAEPMDPG
jgi:hypothetical protein